MPLADHIRIERRFLRSIRIDTDVRDIKALKGFVCPPSSAEVLLSMARHVSETSQGAFTWTGPYGSGKSSLVVALSALLNGVPAARRQAAKIFGHNLASSLTEALPPGPKGWRIVPVVGRRGDPVQVIGEALSTSGIVPSKPHNEWTEGSLISAVSEAAGTPKEYGGLIIFIDEMGKFLEASAQRSADIYVFQLLAEAAGRSGGRLIIVGVLHQAFEEYARRLSREIRDEWAKIQGRFIDLAVNTSSDEQIELISRTIECDCRPNTANSLALLVAQIARRDRPNEIKHLASMLEACWPLHPIVACLLGPMARRRFGQNQRSIFGFLNSAESFGFQEFLKIADGEEFYTPDRLWDYLRANLEPSILASPDGHRWALATEALERCESIDGDSIHVNLLKTIAVIDLCKEKSGLTANFEILRTCFRGISSNDLNEALSQLDRWSLIIFKKFLGAYAVFAGSDFDIDQAVQVALEKIEDIDFVALKNLAALQPVLAKRHYHATGALRWFDVNFMPACDIGEFSMHYQPQSGTIGQFLLAIPTAGESKERMAELCRSTALQSENSNIIGLSEYSWAIVTFARELMALETVRNDRPELAGDAVARHEVGARIVDLQGQLETELRKAFDDAVWYRKGDHPKRYRQAELNILASEIADSRFAQSPKLHNEILNRQKPSSSAIAAQNALLRHMVLHTGKERLGIVGFPAEGGLLKSILEAPGLYSFVSGTWQFVAPRGEDPCRLHPIWELAAQFVMTNLNRTITVSEIYDLWRRPPFGVKEGLLPVLAVAFILSCRNRLAIYREGIFRSGFDDLDIDYLVKDSTAIQIRWMNFSDIARRLLDELRAVIYEFAHKKEFSHSRPIDVARNLIAIYESLPQWTKHTMKLSANAVKIRELFKRAHDPNKFLFDDIPVVIGNGGSFETEDDLCRIVSDIREGLNELVSAYPSMLNRLQDIMLDELQVPNVPPRALSALRERAKNIRQLAGDFQLDAFIGRLSQLNEKPETFETIASLVSNKPPHTWADPDVDRAAINIAEMAQKFLRAETFARVKGRVEKRQAMAVMIGINGRPAPIYEEFDVAEADRAVIDRLVEQVTGAFNGSSNQRRGIVLAAIAEFTAKYLQDEYEVKSSVKRKAVR
jgi:hypothetical protein